MHATRSTNQPLVKPVAARAGFHDAVASAYWRYRFTRRAEATIARLDDRGTENFLRATA